MGQSRRTSQSSLLVADELSYTVTYQTANHWSVITQIRGSKWSEVLPYCLFNVIVMITLTILDQRYAGKVSIKITDLGHTFIALVVAFLLVSRVNIALNRYNQARVALGTMYASSRELVQYAVLFSSLDHTDRAREWRLELSYRLLILLRTSMAVTDFATTHQAAWDVPELHGTLKDDICDSTCMSAGRRWAHAQRNVWEESLRVPIRVAYLLRKSIHSQTTRLDHPMHVTQENILLAKVDAFLTGYYAMRQFLTTPVPFPLIQMARTFLFLYVFTVPLVFVADKSSLLAHCFAIFVLTYGYVGLELVAIELDDPFGDDPNDFNNQALAWVANEDVYVSLLGIDGPLAVDKLRGWMHNPSNTSTIPSNPSPNDTSDYPLGSVR